VKIARATVEMMSASELRKRRNIGRFLGAERMRPIEYFIPFFGYSDDVLICRCLQRYPRDSIVR
jgi:hypothetical protein